MCDQVRNQDLLKIGDETIEVISAGWANVKAITQTFTNTLVTLIHLLQQREVPTSISDIKRRYETTSSPEIKVHWELQTGFRPIKIVGKRKKEPMRMVSIGCYLSRGKEGVYQKQEAVFEIIVVKDQDPRLRVAPSICRAARDLSTFVGYVLTDFPEIKKTVLWENIEHASKASNDNC